MKPRPTELTAVHEEDKIELLDLLGVGETFRGGDLVCVACQSSLLENGLGAVRRAEDGSLAFACERLDCLEEFYTSS